MSHQLQQLLDDSNQRCEQLREQLKLTKQKILILSQGTTNVDASGGATISGKGDLVMQLRQALELNEQRATQVEEAQFQVTSLQAKVGQLESSVASRDADLVAADIRYRKCVEKAKEVIKNLDPKVAADTNLLVDHGTTGQRSGATTAASDSDSDGHQTMRSGMGIVEERLIASAFYRLSLNCHREAVDTRLALLSGTGQSFLARQRQPAPRKPLSSASQFKK